MSAAVPVVGVVPVVAAAQVVGVVLAVDAVPVVGAALAAVVDCVAVEDVAVDPAVRVTTRFLSARCVHLRLPQTLTRLAFIAIRYLSPPALQ